MSCTVTRNKEKQPISELFLVINRQYQIEKYVDPDKNQERLPLDVGCISPLDRVVVFSILILSFMF